MTLPPTNDSPADDAAPDAHNLGSVSGDALSDGSIDGTEPEFAGPESAAPESAEPESAAPESAAPESAAPESAAPESAAPESAAPESAAPDGTRPPAESAGDERSAEPEDVGPPQDPRELLAAIYDDLRRTAGRRLSRLSPGQTFQATALVHEAWLRLEHKTDALPTDRRSFYAAAARAMRDLLVEHARRRGALKRSDGWGKRTSLEALDVEDGCPPIEDLMALEEALSKLEEVSPSKAEIVRLRFFTGLTMVEIAEINGRSLSSVEREWRFARAWLGQKLGSEPEPE